MRRFGSDAGAVAACSRATQERAGDGAGRGPRLASGAIARRLGDDRRSARCPRAGHQSAPRRDRRSAARQGDGAATSASASAVDDRPNPADLLDRIARITRSQLDFAPEPVLRSLFNAFDLAVTYDPTERLATCEVTLAEDSLPTVTEALSVVTDTQSTELGFLWRARRDSNPQPSDPWAMRRPLRPALSRVLEGQQAHVLPLRLPRTTCRLFVGFLMDS